MSPSRNHKQMHNHTHPSNSHLIVSGFDYYAPASLDETLALLHQHCQKARILAGGTHVLVMMKMEREAPDTLIDIQNVPGLNKIRRDEQDHLVIGARATIREVRDHPIVRDCYPALAQACASFGSTQIQEMATIGGNLANGSPASDTPPALLVLGAELSAQSVRGERRLTMEELFVSPGHTALQPDELLTAIVLPPPLPGSTSAFYKLARVSADLAKASVAVMLERDGERVGKCRLAFGSVAPVPLRTKAAEAVLEGQLFSENLAAEAGLAASQAVSPIDDIRSTAWYRREVVKVMTQDLLQALWNGTGTDLKVSPRPVRIPAADGIPETVCVPDNQQRQISLTVNGQARRLWVQPNELLLNVLRERLQLTGTKYGCGVGECSACTIHIDGKPALACLTLAVAVDGKAVTTIEGLQSPTGALDPLQEAFVEHAAFQCGYCTPGILMTVKAMLNENAHPDEDEVRDTLKGNRCRCTGYVSIVRAVMSVVEDAKA